MFGLGVHHVLGLRDTTIVQDYVHIGFVQYSSFDLRNLWINMFLSLILETYGFCKIMFRLGIHTVFDIINLWIRYVSCL